MKRVLGIAAALTWTFSGAALAGDSGVTGIGAHERTTAAVHCDALIGAERDACLREMHERDEARGIDPAAGARGKTESAPPPVRAAPVEPSTPAAATARAADPEAPSGALIIDTPSGKLPKPYR